MKWIKDLLDRGFQWKEYQCQQNEGKIKILRYLGDDTEIVIPDKIQDLPVAELGKKAFYGRRELKRVAMPMHLESIGKSCFEGCTALETVQFPGKLKAIKKRAFYGCEALRNLIYYPESTVLKQIRIGEEFIQKGLPIDVEQIGEYAFAKCKSLQRISIPYQITVIPKGVFNDCGELKSISLHDGIRKIEKKAFAHCKSLYKIRIPDKVRSLDAHMMTGTKAVIICEKESKAAEFAKQRGLETNFIPEEELGLDSAMRPRKEREPYVSFFTEEEAKKLQLRCEIRTPIRKRERYQEPIEEAGESRYDYVNGVYHKNETTTSGKMKILMTGDLMCRRIPQKSALIGGKYDFTGTLAEVSPILKQADFVIGNMETMLADSLPYATEQVYVENRGYLNAPGEFAYAVKQAGFDAVSNAQNHIYDAGFLGVLETLDALNRHELMHVGVRAGEKERPYLLVEANGIRIAVLAYYDGKRQAMKKVNFTSYGKKTIFRMYSRTKVTEDIEAARKEGAEFILVYSHWGREFTYETSNRQERIAQEIANAGADYIFGSHPHCLQRYEKITTEDGRSVPVLYSGGNFLADMSNKKKRAAKPRHTLIGSLTLEKDSAGNVIIKEDGYIPCEIVQEKAVQGRYVVRPTQKEDAYDQKKLARAEKEIEQIVGPEYRKLHI